MSEVKHTPLPWAVVGPEVTPINRQYGHWLIEGATHVASQASHDDARLIVQAVNSHGDLVEALRVARKRLNGIFECSEDRYSATAAETAIAEIDTALSKVLELGEGL